MKTETKNIKLSDKQKEVIRLMRNDYFLYENVITSAARFCLTKHKNNYVWGNVNGNVVIRLAPYLDEYREHLGVRRYDLNELGKTIEL